MRRYSATFWHTLLFSTGDRRIRTIQLIYLAVSCLFLAFFLSLPKNRNWLTTSIQRFYDQRTNLSNQTDIRIRRKEGYGVAFAYTSLIRAHCNATDYFLIPPQRYLIRKAYRLGASTGYAWVYPSVMYYHLGKSVHLIDMVSPDSLLGRASYTFWAQKNQLTLLKLTDQNRSLVLTEFRRYDPHFFSYTPKQAKAYFEQLMP